MFDSTLCERLNQLHSAERFL